MKQNRFQSMNDYHDKSTEYHIFYATLILDEPDTICRALPVAVKNFKPFVGTVTRLHLCAFWPTREIVSIELKGNKKNN